MPHHQEGNSLVRFITSTSRYLPEGVSRFLLQNQRQQRWYLLIVLFILALAMGKAVLFLASSSTPHGAAAAAAAAAAGGRVRAERSVPEVAPASADPKAPPPLSLQGEDAPSGHASSPPVSSSPSSKVPMAASGLQVSSMLLVNIPGNARVFSSSVHDPVHHDNSGGHFTLRLGGNDAPGSNSKSANTVRLLFVMWIGSSVSERMMAIESTWARVLPEGVHLVYFTTPADFEVMKSIPFRYPVVVLDNAAASYPPQSLMMESIRYIGRELASHYDFIMRVDSDNFINVPALLRLLQTLDPHDNHYFGMPGKGRKDIADKLGLPKEYCLGGSGVIMSSSVVQAMSPRVDDCIRAIRTPHEDTELGRCVWITTKTHCHIKTEATLNLRGMFYNIYFTVMNARGMLAAPGLPENINSVAIDAIVLHPVRRFKEFVMLQRLQEKALRPLQTMEQPYTNEKHIYRTACTHDWVAQVLLMCSENETAFGKTCKWRLMRECDTPAPEDAEAYTSAVANWFQDPAMHFYHYRDINSPSAMLLPPDSTAAEDGEGHAGHGTSTGDRAAAEAAAAAAAGGATGEGGATNPGDSPPSAQNILSSAKAETPEEAEQRACLGKELTRNGVPQDRLTLHMDTTQLVQSPPESGGAIHPPATQELASLRAILKEAMFSNTERIMVFHTGTRLRFAENFSKQLQLLLSSPRCGGHLYTEHKGGVLILSPAILNVDAIYNASGAASKNGGAGNGDGAAAGAAAGAASDTTASLGDSAGGVAPAPSWLKKLPSLLGEDQKRSANFKCFSAPLNVTTSVATIFHRTTFPVMARYIDNVPAHQASLSELFNRLIMEGFIVRAASVPLVEAVDGTPTVFVKPLSVPMKTTTMKAPAGGAVGAASSAVDKDEPLAVSKRKCICGVCSP